MSGLLPKKRGLCKELIYLLEMESTLLSFVKGFCLILMGYIVVKNNLEALTATSFKTWFAACRDDVARNLKSDQTWFSIYHKRWVAFSLQTIKIRFEFLQSNGLLRHVQIKVFSVMQCIQRPTVQN